MQTTKIAFMMLVYTEFLVYKPQRQNALNVKKYQ